jgi:hypothetical protein
VALGEQRGVECLLVQRAERRQQPRRFLAIEFAFLAIDSSSHAPFLVRTKSTLCAEPCATFWDVNMKYLLKQIGPHQFIPMDDDDDANYL